MCVDRLLARPHVVASVDLGAGRRQPRPRILACPERLGALVSAPAQTDSDVHDHPVAPATVFQRDLADRLSGEPLTQRTAGALTSQSAHSVRYEMRGSRVMEVPQSGHGVGSA